MNDFDERALTWDDDPMKRDRAETVAQRIVSNVSLHPGMKILDYGCGTGLLGLALHSHVGFVTFADTSSGMLKVVEEKLSTLGISNVKSMPFDILGDPLPADRFDLVASMLTLHHLPDIHKCLAGFFQLLHPGGVLCIADLDSEDGTFHDPGFAGHLGFSREELGTWVTGIGFHEVAFTTVYSIAKVVNGEKRDYTVFLLCAKKPQ